MYGRRRCPAAVISQSRTTPLTLHLSGGVPPMIRVDGDIKRVNMPALTHKDVNSMVYDIMNDKQRKDYEEFLETDFLI